MSSSQQLTIEQVISRAKKATEQGNLAVARQLYNAVLQHQPNHPLAIQGLRQLQMELPHHQSLQTETANPSPDQINVLANLYHSGQMTKAEQACRELLRTYPQSLIILNLLGAVLAGQGQLQQAVQVFDKIIQLKPDYAEAYCNRGNVLRALRQLEAAIDSYDKTIELKPDDAEAYSNRGNAFQELGRLEAAVENYNQAIQLKPDLAGAYINRSNALMELGQLEAAMDSCNRAIELKPDYAEAYSNRGNALMELGQLEAAVASYDQAAQLKPDFTEAYYNRGNALMELRQQEAAVASYDQAIQLNPDDAQAYSNRGNVLRNLGRLEEALDSYDQAIQLKPDYAEAYSNRGNALTDLRQLEEALASYDKAIQLNPDCTEVYSNRGIALTELGQLEAAVVSYDKAIQLKPGYAEAYYNRGNVLIELGQLEKAVESCNQAIQLQPNFTEAYYNRGNALHDLSQLEAAVASYDQAIQLKPDDAEAYSNRGNALHDLSQLEEALASYNKAIQIQPDFAEAYSNLLFGLQYKTDFDPELYLSKAQKFRLNCRPKRTTPFSTYTYQKNPTKLKIGLVSSDFGNHPGGYFSLSTLRELSQKNLELIAYSNFDRSDQWAPRFRPIFAQWHSIQKQTDQDVVAQIVKDGIHILIDLQGHTSRNRLPIFFYKPAPIQATWLSPGSTGIEEIDYYIGSPYLIPEGEEKHFSEQVLRLPETEACFTPPDFELPVNDLPAQGNNFITFGCFNKLVKMNDQVVALWCRILSAVPNSKLLLKSKVLNNQKMVALTRQRFKRYDIDPSRLTLLGWSASRKESLRAYHQVDIALDPFPFQGHTTTCEAVWMGVPVLVLKGDRLLFHAGENVNYNLGMDDWVAENQDQYLSQAVMFSSDLERLTTIRRNLRQQALESPLFDAPRFADHFSRLLWQMWSKSNPDSNPPRVE